MENDNVSPDLKQALLKKQTCFSPLTSEETEKLAALLKEKTFTPGEIIVTEGDPVDSVYLIVEGTADVRQTVVKDGQLVTHSVATIGPEQAIGLNETGFYSISGRRTATVIALTDITSLQLNLAEFHGFALTYSHVSEVMRKNATALNHSNM
jgi:CRP-like cAMP-binding protein